MLIKTCLTTLWTVVDITASPTTLTPISYAATLETGAKIPESQIRGSDSGLGDNDETAPGRLYNDLC